MKYNIYNGWIDSKPFIIRKTYFIWLPLVILFFVIWYLCLCIIRELFLFYGKIKTIIYLIIFLIYLIIIIIGLNNINKETTELIINCI